MPSSKKQKLSKEEKARRKLKSHTTREANEEWKHFDYSRKMDGYYRTHEDCHTGLMIDSLRSRNIINDFFEYRASNNPRE